MSSPYASQEPIKSGHVLWTYPHILLPSQDMMIRGRWGPPQSWSILAVHNSLNYFPYHHKLELSCLSEANAQFSAGSKYTVSCQEQKHCFLPRANTRLSARSTYNVDEHFGNSRRIPSWHRFQFARSRLWYSSRWSLLRVLHSCRSWITKSRW